MKDGRERGKELLLFRVPSNFYQMRGLKLDPALFRTLLETRVERYSEAAMLMKIMTGVNAFLAVGTLILIFLELGQTIANPRPRGVQVSSSERLETLPVESDLEPDSEEIFLYFRGR
ncbi:MAG: hypothetical protein ACE5GQ_01850 [Nitrospinales bacterium]